jgi:hypothetical protein
MYGINYQCNDIGSQLLKCLSLAYGPRYLQTPPAISTYFLLEKHFRLSEEEGYLHEQLEEENAKQILHDVLNELYYSKGKKRIRES